MWKIKAKSSNRGGRVRTGDVNLKEHHCCEAVTNLSAVLFALIPAL